MVAMGVPTRRDDLALEVSARLRSMCGHLPDREFRELVERVLDVARRDERAGSIAVRTSARVEAPRRATVLPFRERRSPRL